MCSDGREGVCSDGWEGVCSDGGRECVVMEGGSV